MHEFELKVGLMIFRQAFNQDISGMRDVRMSVAENELSGPERIPPDMYAHYINDLGRGWVCEIDGEIVGFSVACHQGSFIWALFVRPSCEGRGIGKRLLKLATDWLFENGAAEIRLSTGVSTRADEFYQRQGWSRGQPRDDGEVEYKLGQ